MLNKKINKFGKSFNDIENIKVGFINQNDVYLKNLNEIRAIYKKQPIRKKCKACNSSLKGKKFVNHEIIYVTCKFCTHVNGLYEDTEAFSKKIYSDKKLHYAKRYFEKNYKNFVNRRKKIYIPKAEFLKKNFKSISRLKIIDVGGGSGYFVSALKKVGFKNAKGYEISEKMVKYGKQILFKEGLSDIIEHRSAKEILDIINKTNFNCLSMIGVFEHLSDLEGFMKLVKKNKNIKYIYLCVPMFSFSVIFENVFKKIMNRHLGGAHTHVFTETSLKKCMKRFNFITHSSWWFGTDFYDLYRSLKVSLIKNNQQNLLNKLDEFRSFLDVFQLSVDKQKLSSQVHMLFKRTSVKL